jgi:alpha-beta hydrolase superfamily lysophospholipase
MSGDSSLSTYITADGTHLAMQVWNLAPGSAVRGSVLIVHGLGEHIGRYEHVAQQLNAWGFAVCGYDQWGHGESAGVQGSLPNDTKLLDDLADVVDYMRQHMPPEMPLILLGHSMGGLVVARFVSLRMRIVDGCILSSPALDAGLSAFQKFLVALLPRIAPNLRVRNRLNAQLISHDPAVVAAYQADPLVHDRISARLGRFIANAGPATVATAAQWVVPTLLMYAGEDHLVNAEGSRRFAAATPKRLVESECFDSMYHEIFNELGSGEVFATLQHWLNKRF